MKKFRRVVVKVGTGVLTQTDLSPDMPAMRLIANEIACVRKEGTEVVLVSSGAIGMGVGNLGLKRRPRSIPDLQAAAATGQCRLMRIYSDLFKRHDVNVAQVLLGADDLRDRHRYLNVKNTFDSLFQFGVIPIVNENDSVAVEEIKFGDNDLLSALVANLIGADLLVILTSVDGLYGLDGQTVVREVDKIDAAVEKLATGARSSSGTGGMISKLQAAKIATRAGHYVMIANGKKDRLRDILAGGNVGTRFLPHAKGLKSRKRWIAFTVRETGTIRVDDGGVRALSQKGKSLLASGILDVEGDFKAGDIVSVVGPDGREFARGVANYSTQEIRKIRGLKTTEIPAALGRTGPDEVIHRNNLAVLHPL